jgi:hypothetical protein
MLFSQSLSRALLSSFLAAILSSHLASSAAVLRRQDNLDFQLLGPASVCGNFEFVKGNTFEALCDAGTPVTSSVNMDKCIVNQGGNMQFLFK